MKTTEERIREKRQEIEKLEKEIKELQGPRGLAQMINGKMLYTAYGQIRYDKRNCPDEALWNHICRVCYEVHRKNHTERKIFFRTLTDHEKKISAEMADEIITIWNKYVMKIYGDIISDAIKNEQAESDTKKRGRAARPLIATVIETGERELYRSGAEASRILGIDRANIVRCAQGKQYQTGGRKWEYYA